MAPHGPPAPRARRSLARSLASLAPLLRCSVAPLLRCSVRPSDPGSRLRVCFAPTRPMNDRALNDALRRIRAHVAPYRVTKGKQFRLADIDPADTHGLGEDAASEAEALLQTGVQWLAEQQDMLYAQDRWAVLLELQAMDAAGKDGTIKHVMSGVNPQGVRVVSFKQPSTD